MLADDEPENKRIRTESMTVAGTRATAVTSSTTGLEQTARLLVKKLSDKATAPTRGSARAAGYDMYSAVQISVPARSKALIETDISIACPPGTYGRIAPRSGLAVKHSICTGAGVIDEDYRGPVKVLLFNHGDEDFPVNQGDRIAQLIMERIVTPQVELVDDLDATARGINGFGSTGTN